MKILFIDKTHPLLKYQLEKTKYKCDTAYSKTKSEIEGVIHKYHGIIIRSRFQIDQKFIKKATNLRFIARAGSGMENINLEYAQSKGVKCYNAAEGNRQAVAEHALGMLLCLFNNINKCNTEIKNGEWNRESNRGIELCGKTIGIIGYGNNGSAFAQILKGFGVKVLAYDKYLKSYPYKSNMKNIYNEADILSLHIPLTEETTYLVDNEFINNFRKEFYLLNTARGKCVNTRALVSSLKKGKIKGVCLDVLEHEKTSFEKIDNNKITTDLQYLIKSDKAILSPHIAGWTQESNTKIAKILFKKISSDFLK